MTQILALTAAAFYGVADFAGGLATRSTSAWRVTAWSQLVGVPLLIMGVAIAGTSVATAPDIALGALAGLFGLVGIVLMYSALATGEMSIVAPIIGTLAASIPVAWDVATGTVIEPIQYLGFAIAVGAVLLLAIQPGLGQAHLAPILKAIGAAILFGSFFIAMSYTDQASGLWPLVAARSVSLPIAFVVALGVGAAGLPDRSILGLVVFVGAADMGANLAIVTAVQRGPLGVSAVAALILAL
jgi:hypothetical protein